MLALAGAIVWRKDCGQKIEVMEHQGHLKNVLWVKISGERYAFSYNHEQQAIEMRKGNTQGDMLHSFANSTRNSDIEAIFRRL